MSDHTEHAQRLAEAARTAVDWHKELGHNSMALAELAGALAAWDALAADLRAQADAEPVAIIRTWHKRGEQHAELYNWCDGIDGLPDGYHKLYAAPPPAEPAAPADDQGCLACVTCGQPVDAQPPAALRQPAATDAELEARTGEPHVDGWPLYSGLPPPAEHGELPPLPELPGCDTGPRSSADIKRLLAWGRLALAQSPLPAERVERVMDAVLAKFAWTSGTDVDDALAAVRAILGGQQP